MEELRSNGPRHVNGLSSSEQKPPALTMLRNHSAFAVPYLTALAVHRVLVFDDGSRTHEQKYLLPEQPVPIMPPIVCSTRNISPLQILRRTQTYRAWAWVKLQRGSKFVIQRVRKHSHRKEKRNAFFLQRLVDLFPTHTGLADQIPVRLLGRSINKMVTTHD